MKGYEDVAAGLALLITVIIGGYYYLQSETYHQKQSLHQVDGRAQNKTNYDQSRFEVASKRTE
jgi:hypothetical protein